MSRENPQLNLQKEFDESILRANELKKPKPEKPTGTVANNLPRSYGEKVFPEYVGQDFRKAASEAAPKIIKRLEEQIKDEKNAGENSKEVGEETTKKRILTPEEFENKVEEMYEDKTNPMDDIFPYNRELNRHRE